MGGPRPGRGTVALRGAARHARRGLALIALDTSALAKLVVREDESEALLTDVAGALLVASDLARTELRRAVARAAPDRQAEAEGLLRRLHLVRLDAELLDLAGRLAPPGLRTLDAIHLQSALLLGDELEALITYDTRMADAARAAGLPVRSPV